jgi:uncharacterized protein
MSEKKEEHVKKEYWLAIFLSAACPMVLGASFDCAKASSPIEKNICADKQLSELDEALSAAYKSALANAADPQAVKGRQRAWLTEERNKCQDTPCLKNAYLKRQNELSTGKVKAAGSKMTITGRIESGQMTSSIVTESGVDIAFESNSNVGKRIFDICKVNDVCEVTGVVEADDLLTAVSAVHKLKSGQQVAAKPQVQPRAEPVKRSQSSVDDLEKSFQEHLGYVVAMVQVFMDAPDVQDMAKFAVSQYMEEVIANTSLTVAYESEVLNTKGAVCHSPAADRIPEVLRFADAARAPVMFNPGSMIFVNTVYFRDLCTMYKKAPERVSDLYRQHIAQIKSTTGGKTYEELKRR